MIFTVFISIFFMFLSKFKYKTFYNHVALINLWWGSMMLLSFFDFYNFKSISIEAKGILFIGVLFFNIGSISTTKLKFNKLRNLSLDEKKIRFIKKIMYIIFFINLIYIFKAIKILKTGIPIGYYRYNLFNSDGGILFQNRNIQLTYIYIFCPIMYSSLICGISEFFENKKKLIIISIINIILYSIMTVGRFPFLFMLFNISIYFFYNLKKMGKKIKVKRYIILGIMPLIVMSLFRGGNSTGKFQTVFRYIVVYFTGSLVALSEFLKQVDFNYLYGRATFGFLEVFITPAIKRIFFIENISSAFTYVGTLNSTFIDIGKDEFIRYNAFYTMFQAFYIDFNVIGVIISSFFLGKVMGILFYNFKRENGIFFELILTYMTYVVVLGILKWELLGPTPIIIIFIILSIMKKRRGRR